MTRANRERDVAAGSVGNDQKIAPVSTVRSRRCIDLREVRAERRVPVSTIGDKIVVDVRDIRVVRRGDVGEQRASTMNMQRVIQARFVFVTAYVTSCGEVVSNALG